MLLLMSPIHVPCIVNLVFNHWAICAKCGNITALALGSLQCRRA